MANLVEKFTVSCPLCSKRYVVTTAAIGKRATCKCGKQFVVAKPPEDAEEDEEDGGDYTLRDG